MNKIMTRGLGTQSMCVTQGYAGTVVGRLREIIRLCSQIMMAMRRESECKKNNCA
jgi:hypothetical protein